MKEWSVKTDISFAVVVQAETQEEAQKVAAEKYQVEIKADVRDLLVLDWYFQTWDMASEREPCGIAWTT